MKELPISFSRPMVQAIRAGRKSMTRRMLSPQPHAGVYSFIDLGALGGTPRGPFKPTWGSDNPEFVLPPLEEQVEFNTCRVSPYPVGARLWVREDYVLEGIDLGALYDAACNGEGLTCTCRYLADDTRRAVTLTPADVFKLDNRKTTPDRPQPGRFMYRSCSRLCLEVVSVRVERLQEISHDDAYAEGVEDEWLTCSTCHGSGTHPYGDVCSCDGGSNFRRYAQEVYRELWESLHGPGSWEANPWVWVIGFRVAS